MNAIAAICLTVLAAWVAFYTSQMKKKPVRSVTFDTDGIWTVHDTTFIGVQAERFARMYAKELGETAEVKLPGIEPMRAGDVWELED